jgi:sulfite reductase (NADPH) flavoprotein alpha-component
VVVTSTQGEGEPPEEAVALHKFLFSKKAPKLEGTAFAVFGLGDTSYEFFCQSGKDFDSKLAELGANACSIALTPTSNTRPRPLNGARVVEVLKARAPVAAPAQGDQRGGERHSHQPVYQRSAADGDAVGESENHRPRF